MPEDDLLPVESRQPAYERVKAFIKSHVSSGEWRSGDPVPSETVLALQFGLARMTVNRALRELAQEGVVERTRGSGTRVAALHRVSSKLMFRDIHDEILGRGHAHSTEVLALAELQASDEIAKSLGLARGAKVFHSTMVHLENGVPIQFEDRHVNPKAAPAYLGEDFARVSPTHHLLQHAPLTEASFSIEAHAPSPAEAKALAIKRSEPCLLMRRRTVSGPHVASVVRLVYPGSRYSFSGQFQL